VNDKMTLQQLSDVIELFIPNVDIQTDNHNQVILYTNLIVEEPSGDLREMTEKDFDL
jgi:hypothetical protein